MVVLALGRDGGDADEGEEFLEEAFFVGFNVLLYVVHDVKVKG